MIKVKARANYGFAGTDMTFEEEFDDDVTDEEIEEVIGWHTEVIETDALSKCEPFCLPMPLTDFYIERSEFEVYGNIFDNPELLEVE